MRVCLSVLVLIGVGCGEKYEAGPGLKRIETTFSVDNATVPTTASCEPGQVVKRTASGWECATLKVADVSGVEASISNLRDNMTMQWSRVVEVTAATEWPGTVPLARVSGVETLVGGLEATEAAQDAKIGVIATKNAEQDAKTTDLEANDVAQDAKIGAAETTNNEQGGRLTAIETKNAAQDGKLTTLETSDGLMSSDIVALKTDNTNNKQAIRAAQDDIRSVDGIANQATTDIASMKPTVDAIKAIFDPTIGRIVYSRTTSGLSTPALNGKTVKTSVGGFWCGKTGAVKGRVEHPAGGTGYYAAKARCEIACNHAAAHMCTTTEMVFSSQMYVIGDQLGSSHPSFEDGWVASGSYSRTNGVEYIGDCEQMKADNANNSGTVFGGSRIGAITCNNQVPIHCCL